MLVSCETDIKTIENRIQEMKDIENTVKERKKQMKKSVELLDGIIADGAISDTHLRMLVDEIVIYEKNGKLDIQITLRQARIILTRPKRHIFGVFSLVVFIRRKPYRILRIKIHTKIALVLGRRFFEERIFCRTTSILTRQCEKSVLKKRVRIIRACLTENSARISTTTMKAAI